MRKQSAEVSVYSRRESSLEFNRPVVAGRCASARWTGRMRFVFQVDASPLFRIWPRVLFERPGGSGLVVDVPVNLRQVVGLDDAVLSLAGIELR